MDQTDLSIDTVWATTTANPGRSKSSDLDIQVELHQVLPAEVLLVVLLQPNVQLGGNGTLQLSRYPQFFPQLAGDFDRLWGGIRLQRTGTRTVRFRASRETCSEQ
jgi:hypothetical protein